MRHLARFVVLVVVLAVASDAAIYAYATRERPEPCPWCHIEVQAQKEESRVEAREIGLATLAVNGSAMASVAIAVIRRRRSGERPNE